LVLQLSKKSAIPRADASAVFFSVAFLHLESRRVFITPSTYNPDEAWVLEQAEAFKRHIKDEKLQCKFLMHDRDTKFTKSFNEEFSTGKKEVKISAFRSPNTNAFVGRFIQTMKQECLHHFVVFGRNHFDHICAEYSVHYLEERPHQGLENETIGKPRRKAKSQSSPDTIRMSAVRCKERLGGLLKN